METARVVRFKRIGGPEVLSIEDIEKPEPGPGEVRLEVCAFALNRADCLFIRGQHYSQASLPSRIGSEAAGIVDAIGEGVSEFEPGDKVCTIPFHNDKYGVQGEFAVYPARYVAPWPERLSAVQACSVWMQYLTAYFALLEVGKAGTGDFVLIPAASSSAGLGAIQLVTDVGATAIATTRTDEKKQFILQAGAGHVVVTEREDLARRIDEITDGAGVRLVYDPIGGSFLKSYVDALARHATIFLYGLLSGEPTVVEIVPMVRKAAVLHPYSMFNHVSDPVQLARGKNYIQERLGDGRLTPLVDRVFDFEQVVEAYQYMESNQQKGKIVVRV